MASTAPDPAPEPESGRRRLGRSPGKWPMIEWNAEDIEGRLALTPVFIGLMAADMFLAFKYPSASMPSWVKVAMSMRAFNYTLQSAALCYNVGPTKTNIVKVWENVPNAALGACGVIFSLSCYGAAVATNVAILGSPAAWWSGLSGAGLVGLKIVTGCNVFLLAMGLPLWVKSAYHVLWLGDRGYEPLPIQYKFAPEEERKLEVDQVNNTPEEERKLEVDQVNSTR